MNLWSVALSLFFLLSVSFTASAFDLSGQSRTYLQSRQDVDGTRYMPLYEYLSFRTDSASANTVSFSFGGWYRYDLRDEAFGKKSAGDLQYAYVTIRKEKGNTMLNLGRLVVNEGVASEQIDGGYARTDLKGGLTIAAYGGSPVETAGDTRSGDSVYGGRVSQGVTGLYTLGVSYLQEKNDGKDVRKEEGIDLWLKPFGKMDILGRSTYNALSKAWMQHQYNVLFGPFGNLRLSAEASRVYYKEYFTVSTLSAFDFPNIDPNETVTTLGGSADYAFTTSVSAGVDFKNYDYAVAGTTAKYYGARLAYASGGGGAGLAVHRMDGPTDRLQYDEQRLYGVKKISKIDLTLDLMHVGYQQAINGVNNAYTTSGAVGYALSSKARIVADIEYGKNPDFDRDVRSMLTFVYTFDAKLGGTDAKTRTAGAGKPAVGTHCQEGGTNPVPCEKKK